MAAAGAGMYEAYLISRFFKITAQTKEFPTALVMTNVNITVVTATPAGSDITARSIQCYLGDLNENETLTHYACKLVFIVGVSIVNTVKRTTLKCHKPFRVAFDISALGMCFLSCLLLSLV